MHYCFVTLGKLSECRAIELGARLAERGEMTSYVLDDVDYNRNVLKLHASARREYVAGRGFAQHVARRRALKALAPDFVHFLDPSIKTYFSVIGRAQPRVICDWDEWPSRRLHFTKARLLMERWLDWRMRKKAAVRIVASRFLEAEFRRFGYDSSYLPYAPRFEQQSDGASPFTEPTLVFMGNLHVAYDHDLIFRAALILKKRGVTPRIVAVGEGPEFQLWKTFVRDNELANVSMPGFLPDDQTWPHLRHAHALIFPIRPTVLNLARCPLKAYDYMQARRPILTNRVGEVMEAVRERGIYAEPSAESWADLIERIAREPRIPDVEYGVDKRLWNVRADVLQAAVAAKARHP